MPSDLLQIGVVSRSHGLHGQLRVRLHNPDSNALTQVSRLWTGPDGAEITGEFSVLREWSLSRAQPQPDGQFLVTLNGLVERTAAEACQGSRVFVRRQELSELESDEVYVADLVGLRVQTTAGVELGRVTEILDMQGNLLMQIQREGIPELLIPLLGGVLLFVDEAAGIVRIDPPSGLLEALSP